MIDALSSWEDIACERGNIFASSENSQFSFSRRLLAAVLDFSLIFSSLQKEYNLQKLMKLRHRLINVFYIFEALLFLL